MDETFNQHNGFCMTYLLCDQMVKTARRQILLHGTVVTESLKIVAYHTNIRNAAAGLMRGYCQRGP